MVKFIEKTKFSLFLIGTSIVSSISITQIFKQKCPKKYSHQKTVEEIILPMNLTMPKLIVAIIITLLVKVSPYFLGELFSNKAQGDGH